MTEIFQLKPNFEKETEKREKRTFLEQIGRLPGVKELVAAFLLLSVAAPKKEVKAEIPEPRKTTEYFKERDKGREFKKVEQEKRDFYPELDIYHRFTREENGELKFNWWALLAPLQVEIGYHRPELKEANFSIPYEYARLFDSAKSLDSGDKEKVVNYIEEEIRKELANQLLFLDFSRNTEEVYQAHHQQKIIGTPEHATLDSINITGTASPEGPAEEGSATILPGSLDEKNLSLAKKRATDVYPWLQEALSRLGFETKVINNITAEEIQFNNNELRQLVKLANDNMINGFDDIDKIFNLIRDYNDDIFVNDQELQKELNLIVGNKRMVEVTIFFHDQQQKKVVIPLPILLLLLPGWPLLRRRRESTFKLHAPVELHAPSALGATPVLKNNLRETLPPGETLPSGMERIAGEERTGDTEIIERKILSDEVIKTTTELEANNPNFVVKYNICENNLTELDREIIEERTLIDDLYYYFDNSELIKSGLDYQQLIKETSLIFDQYPDVEQREQAITYVILSLWREHDQKARRQADVQSDEGLNYHEQEKQIMWARFHAREIIKLAEVYQKDHQSLINELNKRVNILQMRRDARK